MSKSFEAFSLQPFLLHALQKQKIQSPTEIQQEAIPVIMEGKDVIGQSQTGTGKTLAYLLPILNKIDPQSKNLQAVILAPTRELCMQILHEIDTFTKDSGIGSMAIIGGADSKRQIEKLKSKPQIIVGTPGRIVELYKLKKLKLHEVKTIIVDEVDQMIDMGFSGDVEGVIKGTLKDRQLLFFSATIPSQVTEYANQWMKEPAHLQASDDSKTASGITHCVITVDLRDKIDTLRSLIHSVKPKATIVFVNRVADIEPLVSKLNYRKLDAYGLHGDTPKQDRESIMNKFQEGRISLLVTSDLAARGLDVEGVTHVINFDPPVDADHYVHRVGRTGRVNRKGTAITIITPKEQFIIDKFQRQLNISIQPKRLFRGQLVDVRKREFKK